MNQIRKSIGQSVSSVRKFYHNFCTELYDVKSISSYPRWCLNYTHEDIFILLDAYFWAMILSFRTTCVISWDHGEDSKCNWTNQIQCFKMVQHIIPKTGWKWRLSFLTLVCCLVALLHRYCILNVYACFIFCSRILRKARWRVHHDLCVRTLN